MNWSSNNKPSKLVADTRLVASVLRELAVRLKERNAKNLATLAEGTMANAKVQEHIERGTLNGNTNRNT
jgi:hypothetical protein